MGFWQKLQQNITLLVSAIFIFGFGFNILSAFAPNVIKDESPSMIWVIVGFALMLIGGLLFIIAIFKTPTKASLNLDFNVKYAGENFSPQREGYWLRLRVVNRGQETAENCLAKITRFIGADGKDIQFDELPLHWIDKLWPERYAPIRIRGGQREFVDVLVQKKEKPTQAFLFTLPLSFPNPLDQLPALPENTKTLEITVYSDNVKPIPRLWDIVWLDEKHTYKSLSLRPSTLDKEGFQKQ